LTKCIFICPIGEVEDDVLVRVTRCIETHCGIVCEISTPVGTPRFAYDERRGQYESKGILKDLIACCPERSFRFLGVTDVDLFVPILTYVFGLAQMDGPCAVVSTHRLRPQFYGEPPDSERFLERVEKTALHELGHCLGLTHCRDRRCVMYSSTRIQDTDFKRTAFCPTCLDLFRWQLERDPGCLRV
jgi:archaemetzincin